MTLGQLLSWFDKWMRLTREQREFIGILISTEKFTVADISELIDHWVQEMIEL